MSTRAHLNSLCAHVHESLLEKGKEIEESCEELIFAFELLSTTAAAKRRKNIKFNDEVLDPFKGQLKCRLDHSNVMHMPSKVENPKHKYCQLCYWAKKEKVHKELLRCEACGVNICINCYSIFHQEESIVAKKRKLFL